jgi:hypothetical protein
MRSSFTLSQSWRAPLAVVFQMCRKSNRKENTVIKGTVRTSELNSFASIRACRPWRVIRAQTWLAGVLILLSFSHAFAQTDFPTFWNKFKSAVIAGDKATIAEMTKFPVSMPYLVKAVKNKPEFLRRYDEIFKGEANAAQCFASGKPRKESAGHYEIYCPFKDTPDDKENAPVRFIFELTKSGWKFSGLDNINE